MFFSCHCKCQYHEINPEQTNMFSVDVSVTPRGSRAWASEQKQGSSQHLSTDHPKWCTGHLFVRLKCSRPKKHQASVAVGRTTGMIHTYYSDGLKLRMPRKSSHLSRKAWNAYVRTITGGRLRMGQKCHRQTVNIQAFFSSFTASRLFGRLFSTIDWMEGNNLESQDCAHFRMPCARQRYNIYIYYILCIQETHVMAREHSNCTVFLATHRVHM